jgi:hypothetical protein
MATKAKASRDPKPFINCLPELGEISHMRMKTPYSPRTIVVDSYLTLLMHPLRPEIVGVRVANVPHIALGTHMPIGDSLEEGPLSFKRLLGFAQKHAKKSDDCSSEANVFRDKFYAIAKGVVGYAKIDHRKLRAVARPR